MIKIECDVCKKDTDDMYFTYKIWSTTPKGYEEHTMHVCHKCSKKIENFMSGIAAK